MVVWARSVAAFMQIVVKYNFVYLFMCQLVFVFVCFYFLLFFIVSQEIEKRLISLFPVFVCVSTYQLVCFFFFVAYVTLILLFV